MDPATLATILSLIDKGLSALPLLIQAGKDVAGKIAQLRTLTQSAAAGTPITDAELAAIEAEFDADLDEFNAPLPDDV
jgi:hypothetical protein